MTGRPSLWAPGETLAGTARVTTPRRQRRAGTTRQALTTERQIAYWRRTGLLRPGPTELAQARAIATLRRAGISLTRIRAATDRLRASWTAVDGVDPSFEPLAAGVAVADGSRADAAVHLTVLAGELFIRHPDGTWEGDRQPGQLVLDGVLPLAGAQVAEQDRAAQHRSPMTPSRRRVPTTGTDREMIADFVARENERPRRQETRAGSGWGRPAGR